MTANPTPASGPAGSAIVIKVFMACFAVYCICMTLFSTAMPEIRLPLFMGFIILAGFLNFPASKHHVQAQLSAVVRHSS
ncbi:MAG: hypothetical protein ACLUN5_13250 [Oscillospiraceae bacterium]